MKLNQLITAPTHVTANTSNCLDHIITNRQEMYAVAGLIDVGLGDHSLVFTAWKKKKIAHTIKYINCRNHRHFNARNYQFDIDTVDWEIILNIGDVNMAADLFCLVLLDVINKHAPFVNKIT